MPPRNHKQKPEFFRFLPSEIVIDILSRLPIRTIVLCKCVCRSWRSLLRTREFADFHFPKSVPGLVIGSIFFGYGSKALRFFEFDDDLGLEHHDLHCKPLTKIDPIEFTPFSILQGSANGLLLLRRNFSKFSNALYICNTITREYIELLVQFSSPLFAYGFGVSRMTGQYKIVRISRDFDCRVYALGTGMWRSIGPTKFGMYDYFSVSVAVCLNGNLHWMVKGLNGFYHISCCDLETETFSRVSLPPPIMGRSVVGLGLVALGGCLCVCDNAEDIIDIWLMKEYGNERSWTKEFVIRKSWLFVRPCEIVRPIKVFQDGDILMALPNLRMIYYSSKTRTTKESSQFVDNKSDPCGLKALIHTPSFFSLDRFTNEKVSRF